MPIHYLTHNEIDKTKWDRCITQSFNGITFAYSWYLDIISPNWDALVEDDYETVFPLTQNKKYGFYYLYQPFFALQLGIFSKKLLSEEIINQFLESIPEKYKFIEINLNTFNKVSTDKFTLIPRKTYKLDLIKPYENIAEAYSTNTKRNIQKAVKQEVVISKSVRPEYIIHIFKKNKGKQISSLKNKHYKLLLKLVAKLIENHRTQIWGAYAKDNRLCAGAFFVSSNNKIFFLFSGTNAEARRNGAMFLLVDNFIKLYSQQNLTIDFCGSNDPNMARFYDGFGAKEYTYFHVKRNNLPWYAKLLKK